MLKINRRPFHFSITERIPLEVGIIHLNKICDVVETSLALTGKSEIVLNEFLLCLKIQIFDTFGIIYI